jgi:hypothetical protein
LPQEKLVQTTVRLFLVDERAMSGSPSIRLTDDLRRLATSVQGDALTAEAEARCRLVVGVSLLQVDVDHFFPWILKDRGEMPDVDRVWKGKSPQPDINKR